MKRIVGRRIEEDPKEKTKREMNFQKRDEALQVLGNHLLDMRVESIEVPFTVERGEEIVRFKVKIEEVK